MRLLNFSKQFLMASCFTLLLAMATPKELTQATPDSAIGQLYYNLDQNPPPNLPSRINAISAQFLGKPYLLGALGEGPTGQYDQMPLYRFDAFDCETYVDTILALALAHNQNQFKQCINQVRYLNGQVSFLYRNHFTCLDWNKNNQRQGFVKDITQTIRDKQQQPVVKFARALIDKKSWYQHMSIHRIQLNQADKIERAKRLIALKKHHRQFSTTLSVIPYIPLSVLFDAKGEANLYLFDQIPNGAIIEIVRPNWDLSEKIGSHLNVSHLGFAIRKNSTLLFREASIEKQQVVDVPLIDYLRSAQKSPTIKGINLQIIQDKPCGEKSLDHIIGADGNRSIIR